MDHGQKKTPTIKQLRNESDRQCNQHIEDMGVYEEVQKAW
jgi:hypothetical protein